MKSTEREVGLRRSPSVRLGFAAALDLAGSALGFALADGAWIVYVVAVVLTAGFLGGTLAGFRLIGFIWLAVLLIGVVSQLLPPLDFKRLPVAVAGALAAWLLFGHLRTTRARSGVVSG